MKNLAQHESLFKKAVSFQKAENPAEAEKIYLQLLRQTPDHPDILHSLGLLYSRYGQPERAGECLRRAVDLLPDSEIYQASLGQFLASRGEIEGAIGCFEEAIEIDPAYSKPYFALAKIYRDKEETEKAEAFFRKTVECAPDHYAAWNNLGNVLQKKERLDEALECFERVIRIKPDIAEVHNNMAGIWKIKGDVGKAEEGYREALRLNPRFDKVHMNLGNMYGEERKLDLAEAHLQEAVRLNRRNFEAVAALAGLMQQQGRVEETIPLLRAAIKLKPDSPGPYIAIGNAYQTRGDSAHAEEYYKKALELEPDSPLALMQYSNLQETTGALAEALEKLKRVVELDPEYSTKAFLYAFQLELKLGIWDGYDRKLAELVKRLESYVEDDDQKFDIPSLSLNYFPIPNDLHHKVALKIARMIGDSMADIKKRCNFKYKEKAVGRMKIGYVSPDFRQHAVGILINEMFRFHDRTKFEVYAYSLVGVDDEISRNIKSLVDSFVDVSKISPEEAARRINEDGIDILIDMAGYTTYSCPSIFALEPAPVQAQYLGYPNSTGADYIKYLLADRQIMDEGLEPFYTEKIVYLPQAFPSSPMEISGNKRRKDYGIPDEAFVYCCSNTSYKIEPGTFNCWMEIMDETPGSLLWLVDGGDDYRARIKDEAKARGIDPVRLLFAGKEAMPDYLGRLGLADLFLDTFIYSAGSTAVCAIHAGLPLLTLKGTTYSSRMGASIIAASGLPELICSNEAEYKTRAVHFAKYPGELESLRKKWSEERGGLSLFDTADFVRNMEKAYAAIWACHLKGTLPANMVIE